MNDAEEKRLLDELAELAKSPGYIHVVAYLAFQSQYIVENNAAAPVESAVRAEFARNLYRQEISVLMYNVHVYADYKDEVPSIAWIIEQSKKTLWYLDQIRSIYLKSTNSATKKLKIKTHPRLRMSENIATMFYTPDSMSNFEYAEMAIKKYADDNEWLVMHKGFNTLELEKFIHATLLLHHCKIRSAVENIEANNTLSIFSFSTAEIATSAKLDESVVKNIVRAFSIDYYHAQSTTHLIKINDFNQMNATPLLSINEDKFICFHFPLLDRALFYTPYYWMIADKKYINKASANRGNFAENAACDYIKKIFGENNTHHNLQIHQGSGKEKIKGEIDILVRSSNILCIFEVKSKALRYNARMGNSSEIVEDFELSVQKSYNQAYRSAELLQQDDCILLTPNGCELKIHKSVKEIYLFSVLAEDCPGLSYMETVLLEYQVTDVIHPPCVIDIFALQFMAEMLKLPLYFFDYIHKKIALKKNILMYFHESLLIANYAYTGLFDLFEKEKQIVIIPPRYKLSIDEAKREARKRNINISIDVLKRVHDKPAYKKIIQAISQNTDYDLSQVGLFLLCLNDSQLEQINTQIESTADGEIFNCRVSNTGFSLMRSDISDCQKLFHVCQINKFEHQSKSWHGLCITSDGLPKYGIYLNY